MITTQGFINIDEKKHFEINTSFVANNNLFYFDNDSGVIQYYNLVNGNNLGVYASTKGHAFSGFAPYKNGLLLGSFIPSSKLYYLDLSAPNSLIEIFDFSKEKKIQNFALGLGAGCNFTVYDDTLSFNIMRTDIFIGSKEGVKKSYDEMAFGNYDLNRNKLDFIGRTPKFYTDSFYYDMLFPIVHNKHGLFFSTGISDTIYELSNRNIVKKHSYLNKHHRVKTFPLKKMMDYDFIKNYFIENQQFKNFLYDEITDSYIHCKWDKTFQKTSKLFEQSYKDKSWSLYLLDNNFKLLDSIQLPAMTYDIQMVYVSNGIIYISKEHELSKSYNDDIYTFEKFKINR